MSDVANPFGDGHAAHRIVSIIARELDVNHDSTQSLTSQNREGDRCRQPEQVR
jgi:hypothetical protein